MQIQEETYPEDPVWLQFIDNNINIVYIVVNSWCLQTQKIQKKLKWTFDCFDVRISKWDFLLRSNLRELQRTLQYSCTSKLLQKMDGSVGILLKICIRRTPYLNKYKKGLEGLFELSLTHLLKKRYSSRTAWLKCLRTLQWRRSLWTLRTLLILLQIWTLFFQHPTFTYLC